MRHVRMYLYCRFLHQYLYGLMHIIVSNCHKLGTQVMTLHRQWSGQTTRIEEYNMLVFVVGACVYVCVCATEFCNE